MPLERDYDAIAMSEYRRAQETLRKLRERSPNRTEDFPPYAVYVMPDGELLKSPTYGFDTPGAKQILTFCIAFCARQIQADAVLCAMDTYIHEVDYETEPFKTWIAETGETDFHKLAARYDEWRKKEYSGLIKNVPPTMRKDALTISGKGPRVATFGITGIYETTSVGVVFSEPMIVAAEGPFGQEEGHRFELSMIDDWWTPEYTASFDHDDWILKLLKPETFHISNQQAIDRTFSAARIAIEQFAEREKLRQAANRVMMRSKWHSKFKTH